MSFTESVHAAEFLVSEANGYRSRDTITVAHTKDLPPGTVLGQTSDTGKFKQLDPSATDGSETAAAVLYDWAGASGGDVKAVGITRDAVVVRRALSFAGGMAQENQDAAVAALVARGIVSR